MGVGQKSVPKRNRANGNKDIQTSGPIPGGLTLTHMGQNQWYHFGVITCTYFSGWIESDVHWGCGVLMAKCLISAGVSRVSSFPRAQRGWDSGSAGRGHFRNLSGGSPRIHTHRSLNLWTALTF